MQVGDRLYGDKTWPQTLDAVFARLNALSATKGSEYAGDTDRLANFRRNAAAIGLQPEQVWAVYAGKHWDAISTFVKDFATGTKRQYSEPIEGRIDDLILYLILFRAMTAERGASEAPQQTLTYCIGCDKPQPWDGCDALGCQRADAAGKNQSYA